MAEETLYALTDAEGVAVNVIVADAAFIKELGAQIADPDVDTGDQAFAKAYDVTGKNVGIGHRRVGTKWEEPPVPEPTSEEIESRKQAEADAIARADDNAFITAMQTKARGKQSFTQDERDRMLAIDLSRR